MRKIYCLCVGSEIHYVGQTGQPLYNRLTGHLSSHPYFKGLPQWLKDSIKIVELEQCLKERATVRERHWIEKLAREGHILQNVRRRIKKEPAHRYSNITSSQQTYILRCISYSKLSRVLGISPETIRLAVFKKHMKTVYFEKIFFTPNRLFFNTLPQCPVFILKINLDRGIQDTIFTLSNKRIHYIT